MVTRLLIFSIAFLSLGTHCFAAETEKFNDVRIHQHRSAQDRVLVDRVGILTFDDTNHKFTFEKITEDRFDTPERLVVPYDAVIKIVFDGTTHMHGAGLGWAPFVGLAGGAIIAGLHVRDYWFYVQYKDGEGNSEALFDVPKESSDRVIQKTTALFGSRVSVTKFQEVGQSIERDKLPDFKSKHSLQIDKQNAHLPDNRPDKATIIVVCPPVAPLSGRGNQYKLHANGNVIAVNREGTYSFAYLDPGKYFLASQAENANGFEMELEAGNTYYLLQNTFEGIFKRHTVLSRNSPELVSYLMSGTYFSEWSIKN
jgi:hypothetical protein